MEGFLEEKKEGQGVLGKTAPSYLGTEQSRGQRGGALAGGPRGCGGGHGGGGEHEEALGVQFPHLFRAEVAGGGASTAAGGRQAAMAAVAVLQGRGRWLAAAEVVTGVKGRAEAYL